MSARALVAMILAFAVPGAGHFYLGRRQRAAIFAAVIVLLFAVGLAVDGGVYRAAGGSILTLLATIGSVGSGLLYVAGRAFGPEGIPVSATFEYGRMFTLTSGLMNLLLVLDCYDICRRRKQ